MRNHSTRATTWGGSAAPTARKRTPPPESDPKVKGPRASCGSAPATRSSRSTAIPGLRWLRARGENVAPRKEPLRTHRFSIRRAFDQFLEVDQILVGKLHLGECRLERLADDGLIGAHGDLEFAQHLPDFGLGVAQLLLGHFDLVEDRLLVHERRPPRCMGALIRTSTPRALG